MTQAALVRPRILWVDLARSVSSFGVILTHVTMLIVNHWDKKPLIRGNEIWWTTGVFYAFLSRFALGLFFMLSGYLLLTKQKDTFQFLKKGLWKLLIPLLFWGTFYLLWHGGLSEDPVKAVKSIIVSLMIGKVEFHLWFLYVFMAIYLFVPILRLFIRAGQDRDVWYYVLIWFLFVPVSSLIFQLTGYLVAVANYAYFSGFIGFFLLGYLLGRNPLDPKWTRVLWIVIPIWAALETAFVYHLTQVNKIMPDQWFDTLTIMVAPYTVLVFLGLKGLGESIQARVSTVSRLPTILEKMSHASFGIILIHVLVLECIYKGIGGIHLAPYDFHPLISVPIVSLVGYVFCFGLVFVMQKIPLLREIVPA
jgi:surface polysaccharide O-acyltransferase-like enzyme